jgi:predicted GIY-YIG superfamily endonuclease
MPKRLAGCYLLHFSEAISGHAGHYLGFAVDIPARLEEHRVGRGARLTQVAIERGITWVVARTWPGETRQDERRHKRTHGPKLCPVCRERRAAARKGAGR